MRAYDELKFRLERQMVRGAGYRLLVIAAAIGLISLLGGAVVLALGSGFGHLGNGVWWAFLRLTDPGYLGDDIGMVNRVVSTLLTVLGYVIFLGALVAVMTQWLNARMAHLEQGLTPVARDDHIIVLGWTNRTEAVVRELLLRRARVRRMLRRLHGRGEVHIVVLARQVTAALAQDLRDALGEVWDERRITLRSGTPLQLEHLERVDAAHAAAVIIPGTEFGTDADHADTRTIKALLSLGRFRSRDGRRPYVVAEIFRTHNVPLARQAYPGELEVVASDAVVSRLVARNVLRAGLSLVYHELLTHGIGNEIYIREAPGHAGASLAELQGFFPRGILLGVVRPGADGPVPRLNPAPDLRLAEGDRLVVLAAEDEGAEAAPRPAFAAPERGTPSAPTAASPAGMRRVLILGWNHKLPALLREFRSHDGESFSIRVLSTLPIEQRLRALRHVDLDRIELTHTEADITLEADLAAVRPGEFDSIVLLSNDRLDTHEESDARTLLAFLVLERLLPPQGAPRPAVIVELLEPDNVELLGRNRGEVIVSPLIVSHMLAQVALRRELRVVFEDLFAAGGAELVFQPIGRFVDGGGEVDFAEIGSRAAARGEIALGVRTGLEAEALHLNPPRDSRWAVREGVEVATLVGGG